MGPWTRKLAVDFRPNTLLDTAFELMSVKEEGVRSKTLGLGEETLIGVGTGRGW